MPRSHHERQDLRTCARRPAPRSTRIAAAPGHRLRGLQEVAGLTGADNFSQAYDRRTRLMVEVQRLCEQRGGQFQLVIEPTPDQDSIRIAQR